MDINKYNVSDTNVCECGHKFDIHEIDKLDTIINKGFYSNIVRTCSLIKCAKCKRETVLLLRQRGQTWEILGIGTPKNAVIPKKVIEAAPRPKIEPKKQTTIENKAEKITSNELICPICKKVCKNQLGFKAHMRSHNT